MRAAMKTLPRFIATIAHSKHRFFVWLPITTSPDQALKQRMYTNVLYLTVMSAAYTGIHDALEQRFGRVQEGGRVLSDNLERGYALTFGAITTVGFAYGSGQHSLETIGLGTVAQLAAGTILAPFTQYMIKGCARLAGVKNGADVPEVVERSQWRKAVPALLYLNSLIALGLMHKAHQYAVPYIETMTKMISQAGRSL